MESRHTWNCASIVAEYDDEIADWVDSTTVTPAEARKFAIGTVRNHMDEADSNAHRQTIWSDAGTKAELAKCGR